MIKSICVFCGASQGLKPVYTQVATHLGTLLGQQGMRVIYGGATIGLMGIVADSVLAAGGEVLGYIPEALLEKEAAHTGVTELKVVHSMSERKKLMFKQSDAFILLPGGLGSLDEFFEALTILQLGFHQKACVILDVDSYYQKLIEMLDHMVKEKFLKSGHRDMILYAKEPADALEKLMNFKVPNVHHEL